MLTAIFATLWLLIILHVLLIRVANRRPQPLKMRQDSDMHTLNEWVNIVHGLAREKGFHEDSLNIDQKLLLIVGELAEAQEELRTGHTPQQTYYNDGSAKPEGFPVELADAAIRLMDLCGRLDIDLAYMVQLKHSYNAGRPYKHGRKF